jgi:uncharacterized membrane protein YbaN (DUF454 family)
MNPMNISPLESKPLACRPVRYATLALGAVCLALGVVGLFVPLLPTTVFLLMALWCFSRSSEWLQRWLYDHPTLGRGLRNWHRHRVIPLPAKIAAVVTMAASFLVTDLFLADDWVMPAIVGGILAAVATFILSRPSKVPADAS